MEERNVYVKAMLRPRVIMLGMFAVFVVAPIFAQFRSRCSPECMEGLRAACWSIVFIGCLAILLFNKLSKTNSIFWYIFTSVLLWIFGAPLYSAIRSFL